MKYGIVGAFIPLLMDKTVYSYTKEALPDVDLKAFRKRHHAEYKAIVARTPGIGSMKENMLYSTYYIACYGFAYYRADERITQEIFEGMIGAVCDSALMAKAYKGKSAFDAKKIASYEKGAVRSQKSEYPMDWKFTFKYNPDVPEYFLTYSECGVCKIAEQEKLQFLVPCLCAMDYASTALMGAKLIRTKTIGNGDECCNFHIVK